MRTHTQARRTASGVKKAPLAAGSASGQLATPARVRQIVGGGRVQAKLTVGAPDDVYEREADRVADAVMRMPEAGASSAATAAWVPDREGARPFLGDRFDQDAGRVEDSVLRDALVAGEGVTPQSADEGEGELCSEATVVNNQAEPQATARQEITTPLPLTAKKKEKTGNATLTVGTTRVTVLPDNTGAVKAGYSAETKTNLKCDRKYAYDLKTKIVSKTTLVWTMTLQTTYKPGVAPEATSAYGRGTTDEDKKAGNISLRFHEGNHGTDYLTYLKDHALPGLALKKGATVSDFLVASKEHTKEIQEYSTAMGDWSEAQTDCVGTKAPFC